MEQTEEMEEVDRKVQFQVVLDQYRQMFDVLVGAGRNLDSKAATLLGASTFFVTITTAAGMSLIDVLDQGILPLTLFAVAMIAFLAMIGLSLRAWFPSGYRAPGYTQDWEKMYADYIAKSPTECYKAVTSVSYDAINSITERNDQKSRYIKMSAWLLAFQVAVTVIAAALSI